MIKKAIHVIRNEKNWSVRTAGVQKTTARAKTQVEAIRKGVAIAKKAGTELVVHRMDGSIKETRGYFKK